jgi:hypothetical protein
MAAHAQGNRAKLYQDVMPFPTAKRSGILTLYSAVMNPFEDGAYGPAKIILHADNRGFIGGGTALGFGDTIDVNVYVSFSHGDSWYRAMTLQDLHRGDSLTQFNSYYILPLAPRIKLEAVFAAGDSLFPGHGCRVDVGFDEMYSGSKRASYIEDVKTSRYGFLGDTKCGTRNAGGGADSLWGIHTSAALNCGFVPQRIFVYTHADSACIKMLPQTTTQADSLLVVVVQTSVDGLGWVHGDSLKLQARPNGVTRLFGQNIYCGAEELTPVTTATGVTNASYYYRTITGYPGRFGQYIRLAAWGDTTFDMRRGHGTRFAVIAFE